MFSDCFCCCVDCKCKMTAGHHLTYDTMEIKKIVLLCGVKKLSVKKSRETTPSNLSVYIIRKNTFNFTIQYPLLKVLCQKC
jgi:hypothetical protein